MQKVTNGAKRKTCKENNIMAKTCSLDGRRDAMKTEATTEAFKETQLVKFGGFIAPGALIVDPE